MGVPRLSRWIMERYPSAVRNATKYNMKHKMDNLYVDFNGLIHESLLRSAIVKVPFSEQELYYQISSYLNEVVLTASPQKKVYIAIDGPSPDAKIRQQRLRRIMGQLTSESQQYLREKQDWQTIYNSLNSLIEQYVINDGCAYSPSSIGITPGTSFMRRFYNYLVVYLTQVTEQEQWGNIEIILSGCQIEGEGEHKIMNEIKKDKYSAAREAQIKGEYKVTKQQIYKKIEKKEATQKPKFSDVKIEIEEDHEKVAVDFQKVNQEQIDISQLNKEASILESNCVFGMDGDLFMLLLGANRPECYVMRRWQGIMVEDFNKPTQSKIDPWNVGMVYVDIQIVREGIVCECLKDYINDEDKFFNLVKTLPQNSLTTHYIEQNRLSKQNCEENEYMVVETHTQLKAYLMEYIMFTEVANRIVNDFIALTLFVGNDFAPEVPGQSIKNSALDHLIDYYQTKFINEIPFKHLLSEKYLIKLQYFHEMFQIIGDECEFLQMVQDTDKFKELHKMFQNPVTRKQVDEKGNWYAEISSEYTTMKESLEELADEINYRNKNKIKYPGKQTFIDYYKKMYYTKFHQLNLEYKVNPPTQFKKQTMKKLMMLDHYENVCENKTTPEYLNQLKHYVENDTNIQFYYGFHKLTRSYLKTLQWVILYYLHPDGCPQWNWEYPYPFTPLCSDMAIYCRMYSNKLEKMSSENYLLCEGGELNQQEDEDSGIESQLQEELQQQLNTEFDLKQEKEFQKLVLDKYHGPQFKFYLGQPKSQLLQLIVTLPRASVAQCIPLFINEKLDSKFFENQPKFQNVKLIDHESAFRSFNCRIDLTQKTPNILTSRNFSVLSYGYHPCFATFYKSYPLGLSDGIDFDQIMLQERKIMEQLTPDQLKYVQATYSKGAELIFVNKIFENDFKLLQKVEKCHQICSNGTIMQFKHNDKYDIDYYPDFRDPDHKQSQLMKQDAHPIKCAISNIFKDRLNSSKEHSSLKNTCIYINSDNNQLIDNVRAQLLVEFSNFVPCQPIIVQKARLQVSKYRGLHLFTENISQLKVQRIKLNVVSLNVNGQCQLQDLKWNYEATQSTPIINQQPLTSQAIDEQLLNFNILKIDEKLQQSELPADLLQKIENHLEIDRNNLLQSQVLSYYNDNIGIIYGFVYGGRIYTRSFSNGQLHSFIDVTKKCEEFYQANKKKLQCNNLTFIENIKKTLDEFAEMHHATSFSDREIVVLMAPVQYQDQKMTINEKTDQQWMPSIMTQHCENWKQFYRTDLCPYENLIVQPVCLQSIHRKYHRTQLLRSLLSAFIQHQAEFSKHKVYFNEQTSVLTDDDISYQINPSLDNKFTQLSNKQLQVLHLANTELNLTNINKFLEQYKQKLDYKDLRILLEDVTIELEDHSVRSLGLNMRDNAYFLTQKKVFNRLAELALMVYISSFPEIVLAIIQAIQQLGKRHYKQRDIFGQLKLANNPFQYEKIGYMINCFKLPVFSLPKIRFQNTLESVLNIMQYYINTIISPLPYQCIINDEETHVTYQLITEIEKQFLSKCDVKVIDQTTEKGQLLKCSQQFKLMDFVYIPQYRVFGYIISSDQTFNCQQYKVLTNKSCFNNYNSSYLKHNMLVCKRDEIYIVSNKLNLDVKELTQQVHNVGKVDLPNISHYQKLQPNLSTQYLGDWLAKEAPVKPKLSDKKDADRKQVLQTKSDKINIEIAYNKPLKLNEKPTDEIVITIDGKDTQDKKKSDKNMK